MLFVVDYPRGKLFVLLAFLLEFSAKIGCLARKLMVQGIEAFLDERTRFFSEFFKAVLSPEGFSLEALVSLRMQARDDKVLDCVTF